MLLRLLAETANSSQLVEGPSPAWQWVEKNYPDLPNTLKGVAAVLKTGRYKTMAEIGNALDMKLETVRTHLNKLRDLGLKDLVSTIATGNNPWADGYSGGSDGFAWVQEKYPNMPVTLKMIVKLILDGSVKNRTELADEMDMSTETLKVHLSRLRRDWGLEDLVNRVERVTRHDAVWPRVVALINKGVIDCNTIAQRIGVTPQNVVDATRVAIRNGDLPADFSFNTSKWGTPRRTDDRRKRA